MTTKTDARVMLQDGGKRTYTCSGTACGYDGKTYCQNCGFAKGERGALPAFAPALDHGDA